MRGTKRRGGFTLIELLVTVAIIAIMTSVLIPVLPDITGERLKSQARKLSSSITHIYDRALSTGITHRLTLDLDKNLWYVSQLTDRHIFEETTLPFAGRVKLPKNMKIEEVITSTGQDLKSGKAKIHFFPGGFAQMSMIYLADDKGREFTIAIEPLTGRARIERGHIKVSHENA